MEALNFSKKIKVLIVDDSSFMRQALTQILSSDPSIEVVGAAHDPYMARDMVKQLNPDVMTLDIQMPKMDGLTFLEKVMTLRPMPVVMISTQTESGASATIQALELGAVDYVAKPSEDLTRSIADLAQEIKEKVKVASRARVRPLVKSTEKIVASDVSNVNVHHKIIAIGASTGGVEALSDIICALPKRTPPILITQHMPEKFTTSFARRLNTLADIMVVEAEEGHKLMPSTVYLAPGNKHMRLAFINGNYVIRLDDGPLVSGHKPSVDVLFHSCAEVCPKNVIGVILTGMGRDGAEGLKHLRESGARTIGQDESTSLVYGMPKAAKDMGGVMQELPLNQIPKKVMELCQEKDNERKS